MTTLQAPSGEPVPNVTPGDEAEEREALSEGLLHFWNDRDVWPEDGHRHTFLARAVDTLGNARFGKDWVALSDPLHPSAYDQRGSVFKELVEAFRAGKMTTFTRAIKGGEYEPAEGHMWNTEVYRSRFKYCRLNRAKPFKPGSSKDGWYVYVDNDEFASLVRSAPTKSLRIDDADNLPIFLAVLVRAAAALEITSDSPALPKRIIMAKVDELARRAGVPPEHISGHLLRYGATILRPPGARRTAHKK